MASRDPMAIPIERHARIARGEEVPPGARRPGGRPGRRALESQGGASQSSDEFPRVELSPEEEAYNDDVFAEGRGRRTSRRDTSSEDYFATRSRRARSAKTRGANGDMSGQGCQRLRKLRINQRKRQASQVLPALVEWRKQARVRQRVRGRRRTPGGQLCRRRRRRQGHGIWRTRCTERRHRRRSRQDRGHLQRR